MATGSLLSYLVVIPALLTSMLLDQSNQEETGADLGFGLELILAKLDEMNLRILNLEQQLMNQTIGCLKTPAADQPKVSTKVKQTSTFDAAAPQEFDESEVYRSCSEIPDGKAGQYLLRPTDDSKPFYAVCDNTYGIGWMVIQNRFNGSENFYRKWSDYKNGFGSLEGEFWYGLDRIHLFTSTSRHEIMFALTDSGGKTAIPKFSSFAIGNETELYKIKDLGSFTGSGGDSFSYHRGMNFSTHDRDNDLYSMNCARNYYGAWWYKNCYHSNLNGQYTSGQFNQKSMCWNSFPKANTGLQRSKIMIREV
ncbi:microfibril-associated glycoprotein 4-like [Sabethes cyaneus]|uniref:microfibril-associated glycoprotein 4-like n=1 Tax=Sabethes cyaneus TaxID=53552 RepID=UPI00237DA513|nr:microfibril-associated glycoprotein 4-like [Sabethes cyaneus]